MMDIEKDITAVVEGGMDLRARLILWLGASILLLVAGIAFAHHFEQRGRTLERAGWVKKEADERAADLALTRKHEADMQALRDHQLFLERKTSEDHEQELAQVRAAAAADRADADRRGGLRIPAPPCTAGTAVAGTETPSPGRRDETGTPTVRLPQQVENDLWALADDADEVSAQLRACQGWIRDNEFYGDNSDRYQRLLGRMIPWQNKQEENTHE
jgi:hypothetical protein